jgi:hypothetical protein
MYLHYSKFEKAVRKARKEYEELHQSKNPHLQKVGFIGIKAIDKARKEIINAFKENQNNQTF